MRNEIALEKGERLDNIGFGNLRLIQKPEDFCYGIDAVILADFASRRAGSRIKKPYDKPVFACDLGTGTGVIPLILSAKLPPGSRIFGVEVQEESFKRAERNVALNGLEERLFMLCGDVSDEMLPEKISAARCASACDALKAGKSDEAQCGAFDIVTANPPYFEGGKAIAGKNAAKQIARQETTGTLEDFVRTAASLLRKGGDFYMVHRPSRLVDICCLFRKYGLEPKTLRFVCPKIGSAPNIMLIHGTLGAGKELELRENLVVYGDDGAYTDEINMIYER